MGGSLGATLRIRYPEISVTGYDPSPNHLEIAVNRACLTGKAASVQEAVQDANIVIVAAPMGAYESLAPVLARSVSEDAAVYDLGSTKRYALQTLGEALGPARFVACHPLAGAERSGPEASRPDLLPGRLCVITPAPSQEESIIANAEEFWSTLGMRTRRMSAEAHDAALAVTSHLPHVLAYAYSLAAAEMGESLGETLAELGAGSFADVTRVAASRPDLWTDILLLNREPVLQALDSLLGQLSAQREALAHADRETLSAILRAAHAHAPHRPPG